MEKKKDSDWWKSPEFILVIVMLLVLTILVFLVLYAPVPSGDSTITGKDLLDYRQSILAVIIAAFGAWVGAGAAYYFGRESQRQATKGMLDMKGPSARERLRQTLIREIPPRQLDWSVKNETHLEEVLGRLKKEPKRWFIPILKEDGTIDTVIDEEAVYRFLVDTKKEKGAITTVLKYLDGEKELQKRTKDIHVKLKLDHSTGYANDLMRDNDVRLGIVTDDKGKPTHYITTGDLRRVLMQCD